MSCIGSLLDHNLFVYCANNPLVFKDSNGTSRMYDLGRGYQYRVDPGTDNQPHIHIIYHAKQWAQKLDGNPHEENNSSGLAGAPPKWVRDKLKQIWNNGRIES